MTNEMRKMLNTKKEIGIAEKLAEQRAARGTVVNGLLALAGACLGLLILVGTLCGIVVMFRVTF